MRGKVQELVLLSLVAVALMAGCTESVPTVVERSSTSYTLVGQVLETGQSTTAQLLVVCDDGSNVEGSTDSDGKFRFELEARPLTVFAVKAGFYGETDVSSSQIVIELAPGKNGANQVAPLTKLSDYWFGVYDADSHGDVRFRYRYNFSCFRCINWMPNLGEGGPNPNNWTAWNLSDFLPVWKGKKLLVPRRYQWFHQMYYGYPIRNALYLNAHS